MTRVQSPINIEKWIEENAEKFKPPVSNRYLYDGRDFFVMVIKGPNARNDFHLVDSEEYFYQLKGDIKVRIREGDTIVDHIVREGETFFIPPNVPHSPSARQIQSVWLWSGAVRRVKRSTSFSIVKIVERWLKTSTSIAKTSSTILARQCSNSGAMTRAGLAKIAVRKWKKRSQ